MSPLSNVTKLKSDSLDILDQFRIKFTQELRGKTVDSFDMRSSSVTIRTLLEDYISFVNALGCDDLSSTIVSGMLLVIWEMIHEFIPLLIDFSADEFDIEEGDNDTNVELFSDIISFGKPSNNNSDEDLAYYYKLNEEVVNINKFFDRIGFSNTSSHRVILIWSSYEKAIEEAIFLHDIVSENFMIMDRT